MTEGGFEGGADAPGFAFGLGILGMFGDGARLGLWDYCEGVPGGIFQQILPLRTGQRVMAPDDLLTRGFVQGDGLAWKYFS